jgi:hypothetical protein
VWIHTDKICLPTVILWLIFVWMEAKIRWKDNRNLPHLDLCRPFAAHCIGYPMVTLGFGFKSYIGYRIRQRKQREVAKENEFYMQLLQQALPQEEIEKSEEQQPDLSDSNSLNASSNSNSSTSTTTATVPLCKNTQQQQNSHGSKVNANGSIEHHQLNGSVNTKQQNLNKKNAEKENGCLPNHHNHHLESNQHSPEIIPNNAILSKSSNTTSSKANHLNYNNLQSVKNTNNTSYQQIQNGIASPPLKELNVPAKCSPYKNKSDDHNTYIASANKKEYEKERIITKDSNSSYEETSPSTETPSQKVKVKSEKQTSQQAQQSQQKDNQQYHQQHQPATSNNLNHEKKQCEQCHKMMEQETKRLKAEMQTIKNLEHEVRQKYENVKGCLQTKQKDCEELQKQLSFLILSI